MHIANNQLLLTRWFYKVIWGLASDDVRKPSNAWQRGKLVLNKDCVPYKSMLGGKSFAVRSSLFFRREVWTVLTTLSQLCASHIKRFRHSDKCGAVFRSIDDLACFCMGRCLCLEPILPVAALWRSTCKPYRAPALRTFFSWMCDTFGAKLICNTRMGGWVGGGGGVLMGYSFYFPRKNTERRRTKTRNSEHNCDFSDQKRK